MKVGGIARNEQGTPISNAGVSLSFQISDRSVDAPPGCIIYGVSSIHTKTDAQGRWTTDVAPQQWSHAWIQLSHPDYYGDECLTELDATPLRACTAEAVMTRGRAIAGRVISPDGKPLPGVQVQCGHDLRDDLNAKAITDADGAFRMAHASTGPLVLTVRAPGFAPFLRCIPAGGAKELDLRLELPQAIHGTVVDASGKPVADAEVRIYAWKGFRNVGCIDEWGTFSDTEGRFELNLPPAGDVSLSADKSGYLSAIPVDITGPIAPVFILQPFVHVSGAVTDSSTGRPIAQFRVSGETDDPGLMCADETVGNAGRYELVFQSRLQTHRVQVQAEGYVAVHSEVLKSTNGELKFDAALTPARKLSGAVVDLTGTPIFGATVATLSRAGGVTVDPARMAFNSTDEIKTTTDSSGHFSLFAPGGDYDLFVLHESGYAVISDREIESVAAPIRLTGRWARIEGTVWDESAAAGGVNVFVETKLGARIPASLRTDVRTDARGHYVIERVPAGALEIVRSIKDDEKHHGGWIGKSLEAVAGKTHHLDFGKEGRTVVGTAVMPPDLSKEVILKWSRLVRVSEGQVESERSMLTYDQRFAHGFEASYEAPLRDDGTFVLPAVEPGRYRLRVQAKTKLAGGYCGDGETIAEREQEIIVDAGGIRPISLGKLEIPMTPRIGVGDNAPNFKCPTFDGKTFHLSEARGKFVVLDFWATWCGPCRAETPYLIKAYDRFGADSRILFVGLNLDADGDAAREYAANEHLKWTQGYLGEWDQSRIREDYKVNAIPSIWLIAPDGKVVTKNLRGDGIVQQIEQAMK